MRPRRLRPRSFGDVTTACWNPLPGPIGNLSIFPLRLNELTDRIDSARRGHAVIRRIVGPQLLSVFTSRRRSVAELRRTARVWPGGRIWEAFAQLFAPRPVPAAAAPGS